MFSKVSKSVGIYGACISARDTLLTYWFLFLFFFYFDRKIKNISSGVNLQKKKKKHILKDVAIRYKFKVLC